MTRRAILGVDLGGTHVRAGRVEGQAIRAHAARAISSRAAAQVVIDEICATIDEVFLQGETSGIGIGVPSIVDTEAGIVYSVENIPSWKEVHLKELLEARYVVPVRVNNDANCFALGELHFGKGRGCRHLVGLVVGTGMGAGVIANGHLYSGANCGAGELGAIPYRDKTIEGYVSGTGLKNVYGSSRTARGAALLRLPARPAAPAHRGQRGASHRHPGRCGALFGRQGLSGAAEKRGARARRRAPRCPASARL
ncbi:MAG: ROK family protein [Elusimicrobia bacterium]|nr:ROK family protein [Elusimicrobiota bacterium]